MEFHVHPESLRNSKSYGPNDTVLYAGILNASGRQVYRASNNTFILTERRNNTIQNDPPYGITARRPVLSCWQTTAWEMEGKRVGTYDLSQLPSLNETVAPFLRETVFLKYLGLPRVATLASTLGPHANGGRSKITRHKGVRSRSPRLFDTFGDGYNHSPLCSSILKSRSNSSWSEHEIDGHQRVQTDKRYLRIPLEIP